MFIAADKPYPPDIRTLTSLRFFAALAVVVFHYMRAFPGGADAVTALPGKGYLAVDFFFILSGFILAHVYLPGLETGTFRARDFYAKRLARIYPVHFFTILVAAVLFIVAERMEIPGREFSFRDLAANLLLVHAWGVSGDLSLNKPSWSISAEWFAYLLFPVLAMRLRRWPEIPAVLAAFALFVSLWLLTDWHGKRPLTELTYDWSILRIFPEFLAGIALYRFGRRYRLRYGGPYVFGCCAAIILAMAHFAVRDLFIVPFFALLILIAAEGERQGENGVLARPVMVYLGEISYSLYMLHFLVLEAGLIHILYFFYGQAESAEVFTAPTSVFMGVWVGSFLATLILSGLSYHFIEKPGRRWMARRLLSSPALARKEGQS